MRSKSKHYLSCTLSTQPEIILCKILSNFMSKTRPPTFIINQENTPQNCLQGNLMNEFSQCPFSQMAQAYVKLTKRKITSTRYPTKTEEQSGLRFQNPGGQTEGRSLQYRPNNHEENIVPNLRTLACQAAQHKSIMQNQGCLSEAISTENMHFCMMA